MSAPPSKEVRAHLLAAKTALASGTPRARARASCRSALALDDTSYDAWVFDGKAAFACGDAESALASYRVAAGVRDDHPRAWRGALGSRGRRRLLRRRRRDGEASEPPRG